MNTKSVMLTEEELEELIHYHGRTLHDARGDKIDRINYLNRRLKTFSEPEITMETAKNPSDPWSN